MNEKELTEIMGKITAIELITSFLLANQYSDKSKREFEKTLSMIHSDVAAHSSDDPVSQSAQTEVDFLLSSARKMRID